MKKAIFLCLLSGLVLAIGCDSKKASVDVSKEKTPEPFVEKITATETEAKKEESKEIPPDLPVPIVNKTQPLAQFIPNSFEGAVKLPSVPRAKTPDTFVAASYTTQMDGKRGVISLRITDLVKGGKKTVRDTKVGDSIKDGSITYQGQTVDSRYVETSFDSEKKMATAATVIDNKIQIHIKVRPAESAESAKRYLSQMNFLSIALHLKKQRESAPLK